MRHFPQYQLSYSMSFAATPELTSLSQTMRATPWRLRLLHAEPAHRLIHLSHGQGRALLGTRPRGLGANSVLFIPAGQSFAFDTGPTCTGHLLTFSVPNAIKLPASSHLIKLPTISEQAELTALMDALRQEAEGERELRDEALDAHLKLTAIWIRRHLPHEDTEDPASTASDRLLAAFLDDLERLHASGSTMADYATRLDVTPTHLSRVCKSQLGKSAADLIVERSLHASRLLLSATTLPAQGIAKELGFGSAAYFSRFILKHTGMSPRALRKVDQAT